MPTFLPVTNKLGTRLYPLALLFVVLREIVDQSVNVGKPALVETSACYTKPV